MSLGPQVDWRVAGEQVGNCNCAWGCPCQFNALPTAGRCEGLAVREVREGHFGETRLDGVRFACIYRWPGPIHEGGGTRQMVVDAAATREQREALEALERGEHGGAAWKIFAATCPTRLPTVYAAFEFEVDRERRQAAVRVGQIVDIHVEPIRNPVTGGEHRARIDLPEGFEYKRAEVANTTSARVAAAGPLSFTLENTYAQLNAFEWMDA